MSGLFSKILPGNKTHREPAGRAVVIGGGCNGLIIAAYLARAGVETELFEARENLGGGTISVGGYSRGRHVMRHLDAGVVRDLKLYRHGLKFAVRALPSRILEPQGHGFLWGKNPHRTAETLVNLSERDARRLPDFMKMVESEIALFEDDEASCYQRMILTVFDVLDTEFETDILKAFLSYEACFGSTLGPHSPGSYGGLLMALSGESCGQSGTIAYPQGGLGSVPNALASAFRELDGRITLSARVKKITYDGERSTGVELEDGRHVRSDIVVVAVDPQTALHGFFEPWQLPTDLIQENTASKSKGSVARVNLQMGRRPDMTGHGIEDLACRFVVPGAVESIEEAHQMCLSGSFINNGPLEFTFSSVLDPESTAEGTHLMQIAVPFVPYENSQGWEGESERFANSLLLKLDDYVPGIGDILQSGEVLLPPDIESTLGVAGGDLFGSRRVAGSIGSVLGGKNAYILNERYFDRGLNGISARQLAKDILSDRANWTPDPSARFNQLGEEGNANDEA